MNQEEFEKIMSFREAFCRDVLHHKGEIYATDDNRLSNFNSVGAMNDGSPQEALWGMVSKHIIATKDMAKSGETPTKKWIAGYLGDIHNYMYLLEAIWEEAREKEEEKEEKEEKEEEEEKEVERNCQVNKPPVVAVCSKCGLEHHSHMAAAKCCR